AKAKQAVVCKSHEAAAADVAQPLRCSCIIRNAHAVAVVHFLPEGRAVHFGNTFQKTS
ncbi:MAG: hypothetical protein QOJ86_5301, partial [Bradyrhizobium sp.]|nr:hypothetical protein [Bradyrhizobium sp.]